jgi:hypothetical protein
VVCGDRRRGVASVKPGRVLAGGALFGGVAWIGVLMARRIFIGHLDALDAELRNGAAGHVVFEQSGQMWRTPASAPSAFTARQTTRHDAPGFLWRAAIGPIVVADYFVAGTGGLEVKLLGAFPIARAVGGTAANQAEALRYLAELPWCPDAILLNRALDWTAVDANTIKVATGVGAARGEVTFTLDDEGLIARASAPSRAYAEHGRTTARPWRGRFWDYQRVGGHLIPIQGEVAWGLDAGDFVYWRGRILAWNDTRPMAQ